MGKALIKQRRAKSLPHNYQNFKKREKKEEKSREKNGQSSVIR